MPTQKDPLPHRPTLPTNAGAHAMAFFHLFRLGLKVLASEFQWIVIAGLRNWEIAQLRKRLSQEYRTLGMIEAAGAGLELAKNDQELEIFDEKELAINQIAFLLDEIAYLKAQVLEERSAYIQRRVRKWNLAA